MADVHNEKRYDGFNWNSRLSLMDHIPMPMNTIHIERFALQCNIDNNMTSINFARIDQRNIHNVGRYIFNCSSLYKS